MHNILLNTLPKRKINAFNSKKCIYLVYMARNSRVESALISFISIYVLNPHFLKN